MLKNVNGSKTLALISYNAGQFSKDLKRVEQMTNINTETANYVTKISRFLEKVKDTKPLKLDAKSSDK
jgi:soluble lytic murein transglycosylase-like protein